jgi:two-component system, OmpR family, sensor kinase
VTLRARLLLATGVVAVVFVLAAVVVTRVTTSYLTDQVDTQLLRFAGPETRPVVLPPTPLAPPADSVPRTTPPSGNLSTLYIGVFEASRLSTVVAPVRGSTSEAIPEIERAATQALVSDERVITVGSTDGSTRYRVTARLATNGDVVLLGLQLVDVDAAIRRLTTVLTIAGVVAFVALGLITWWVLRLGVRPIQRMTAVAKAVAAGELSTRIHRAPKGTEAADLGDALNTMLERIERALAERAASEERLRQFLADASHELRTPVATIRGYAELYRTGAISDALDLETAMARTEAESIRLGRLVADITALARLEDPEPRPREVVMLNRVTANAVSDLRVTQPDRVVTTHLAPVSVLGDSDQLHQVVVNLCDNAATHTAKGTPIEVTLDVVDDRAFLAVVDHGAGIDPEAAQHAFERFYRADRSRNSASGGSGLGLAIVAGIVQAHGGDVHMKPRSGDSPDGPGTTVVVELPTAAASRLTPP